MLFTQINNYDYYPLTELVLHVRHRQKCLKLILNSICLKVAYTKQKKKRTKSQALLLRLINFVHKTINKVISIVNKYIVKHICIVIMFVSNKNCVFLLLQQTRFNGSHTHVYIQLLKNEACNFFQKLSFFS